MSKPQGNTPARSIRVPDDLWDAAKAKAAADGTTVSEAVIRFLRRWAKTQKGQGS